MRSRDAQRRDVGRGYGRVGVEPTVAAGRSDLIPAAEVLALHDDGRFWVALLLDQYRNRNDGRWRVVVTYSTGLGRRYIRALPTEVCRR